MDTTNNTQPEKIRVFPMADPRDWVENQDFVKKTIVTAINPSLPGFLNVKHFFSIDPISGWIRYRLENDLWHNKPKRSLPQSSSHARQVAEQFIQTVQSKCLEPEFKQLNIAPIFPVERLSRIHHLGTAPVFHNTQPWVDHWISRFEVRLKPFENESEEVSVKGSAIEIRIGQAGKVVGLVSQWRPVRLSDLTQSAYLPFDSDTTHEDGHNHDSSVGRSSVSELVYELFGEDSAQNFLLPFHLTVAGHHNVSWIASEHSFIPFFHQENKSNGKAVIYGAVEGGSGDFLFYWSYYQIDAVWDDKVKVIGEGQVESYERENGDQAFYSSIELDSGVYNLILHVMDIKTSIIRQRQITIYTQPEVVSSESLTTIA